MIDQKRVKAETKWAVFGADGITLRGPIVADEVCESLEEAFQEAATLIADGIYMKVEIAKARYKESGGYWYDFGARNRISIDAEDFEMPEED